VFVNPITLVHSARGAPMGRPSDPYLDGEAGLIYLRPIPLDSGGYDRGGAYWGLGDRLWIAQDQFNNSVYLRAKTRPEAKQIIRAEFGPDLRFFR